MRLVSLLVTMVVASVLTFYALMCSVNNAPTAPVHPIVGKWHRVLIGGLPVSDGSEAACKFSTDGRFVWERVNNDFPNRHEGSYKVDQDVLIIVSDPGQEHGLYHGQDGRRNINFSQCRDRMEIKAHNSLRTDTYIRKHH